MAFKGERVGLCSDLGQMYGPPHPEGIRMGIAGLLGAGVPTEPVSRSPARLTRPLERGFFLIGSIEKLIRGSMKNLFPPGPIFLKTHHFTRQYLRTIDKKMT
jgi:hypothetical protein